MITGRRGALAIVAGAALFVACTLDWQVRPDPGTTPPDLDASTEASASTEADAAAPAPADAEAGTSTDCTALRAEAAAVLQAARKCGFAVGECQPTVKDDCNCDVVVARADGADTNAYRAKVERMKAECPRACGSCPSVASRACLQKGNGQIECYP